jgi:Flp pilus assembly protein TadG
MFLKQFWRCTEGAALIEAALVFPVVISLMAGAIDFARAFTAYTLADRSMRDAARYLARVPSAGQCGWGLTNAKNLAVYGKISPGASDQPLVYGWTTSSVTMQTCPSTSVIDLRSPVTFTGLMLSAVLPSNALTFTVKHQERYIGE